MRRAAVAALVAAAGLAGPATPALADDLTAVDIDDARAMIRSNYWGPPPLFFDAQAVAHVPLEVNEVSLFTGDEYGATAFYEPINGDDSTGQLWMSRAPAVDPKRSFRGGSCQGAEVEGPMQLGPYTAYFARCDLSFI